MDEKVAPLYGEVIRRSPGEVEFHQAVREVLSSLGPVLASTHSSPIARSSN